MKVIHKEYEQAFLVEPTKLNRIVGKVHERLGDHSNCTTRDSFEAFLTGNQREEVTTLDELLALDNSHKHRVERLVILCSASMPDAARPEHEVQVDFDCPKPASANPGSATKAVTISVRSDVAAWASRTLSEVEEQVERTWLHYTWPVSSLFVLAIMLFVVMLYPFISLRGRPRADTLWLYQTDVDRIEAMLKERPALTDEQVREISTMQLRNVLGFPKRQTSVQANEVTRIVFLVAPAFVVIVCIVILLKTCYPRAVFLWGDEVDRHANRMQRRKIIWNIIIGVAVVGVLSQVFVQGLLSWLPHGHS
jgi:hypothetical protein